MVAGRRPEGDGRPPDHPRPADWRRRNSSSFSSTRRSRSASSAIPRGSMPRPATTRYEMSPGSIRPTNRRSMPSCGCKRSAARRKRWRTRCLPSPAGVASCRGNVTAAVSPARITRRISYPGLLHEVFPPGSRAISGTRSGLSFCNLATALHNRARSQRGRPRHWSIHPDRRWPQAWWHSHCNVPAMAASSARGDSASKAIGSFVAQM